MPFHTLRAVTHPVNATTAQLTTFPLWGQIILAGGDLLEREQAEDKEKIYKSLTSTVIEIQRETRQTQEVPGTH